MCTPSTGSEILERRHQSSCHIWERQNEKFGHEENCCSFVSCVFSRNFLFLYWKQNHDWASFTLRDETLSREWVGLSSRFRWWLWWCSFIRSRWELSECISEESTVCKSSTTQLFCLKDFINEKWNLRGRHSTTGESLSECKRMVGALKSAISLAWRLTAEFVSFHALSGYWFMIWLWMNRTNNTEGSPHDIGDWWQILKTVTNTSRRLDCFFCRTRGQCSAQLSLCRCPGAHHVDFIDSDEFWIQSPVVPHWTTPQFRSAVLCTAEERHPVYWISDHLSSTFYCKAAAAVAAAATTITATITETKDYKATISVCLAFSKSSQLPLLVSKPHWRHICPSEGFIQ